MTKRKQDAALLQSVVKPLLEWYGQEARDLPWRKDPQPYHIWLSEIIFQQTRIEAGTAYYLRFLQEVPGIKELAELPEEKLLKLWEGLGYYNRARNLQKAAKLVMAEYGGKLPAAAKELVKLPGIGSYTAGAIASIAFGEAVPAVDGNVLRVLSRVLARQNDIALPETKKNMELELGPVIPAEAPGDFNQALMDLGATVCIPNGEPRCQVCPLQELCRARIQGLTAELPVKGKAKARRVEKRTLVLMTYPGKDGKKRCFLQKRNEKGLLAGLWEIPGAEGDLGPSAAKEKAVELLKSMGYGTEAAPAAEKAICKPLPESKHVFSHVEWHMKAWEIAFPEEPKAEQEAAVKAITDMLEALLQHRPEDITHQVWATAEEVDRAYSLPSAFKAYKKYIR